MTKNEIFVSAKELERQRNFIPKVRSLIGEGKKYCIQTFGCQQNEADSERLAGLCAEMGYNKTDSLSDADLIIYNTCAIREHAELKALSKAGQLKKLKEAKRSLVTAICGCMIEQEHRRTQLSKSYPYVDFVFGTDRHHALPEMVYTALTQKGTRAYVSSLPHNEFGIIAEGLPVVRESSYKAWVSIMYGCNNFCSYCVVPYVRGRERSRRSEDVLKEVETLVKMGYKDITLLGQNVNSYRGDYSFPELLDRAASFDGEYRVRFMTSHPKDASKELIDVMAANPRIAKHFHLPVQSGDNRILKLMNRGYTREEYLEKAYYIREKMPEAAISSDIICGFPTETESEFDNTVDIVEKVGFDMLFTFVYSPRKGTVAAEMEGQVPHEVKTARFARLSAKENLIAEGINKQSVGKTFRVLSEGVVNPEDGIYSGRTTQNKIISFSLPEGFAPEKAAAGHFLDVKVNHAQAYALTGTAVKKN